jgi:hypothetical protein
LLLKRTRNIVLFQLRVKNPKLMTRVECNQSALLRATQLRVKNPKLMTRVSFEVAPVPMALPRDH